MTALLLIAGASKSWRVCTLPTLRYLLSFNLHAIYVQHPNFLSRFYKSKAFLLYLFFVTSQRYIILNFKYNFDYDTTLLVSATFSWEICFKQKSLIKFIYYLECNITITQNFTYLSQCNINERFS